VSCRRLEALGWKPSVPFEEGLRETICWYQSNESWWRKIKSGEFAAYYKRMYERRLQDGAGLQAEQGPSR
jgi:dTDP-glucose 4,6-dehydratase